jgi:hypothetical protein
LKHWLWLSLAILLLDQASKWMVLLALEPYEVIALMPNVNLTLMFNTGAAFSFLADSGGWQRWFFVALALIVSGVLVGWLLVNELAVPVGFKPAAAWRTASTQHALEILQHQEQMIRVGRAGLEFPGFVPAPRRLILGMHQQAADAGDVGGLRRAQQSVLEQRLTQPFALMRP